MKNLFLIAVIVFTSCKTNPVDTYSLSKRVSIVEEGTKDITINMTELSHTVDSLVSWKMSQNSSQDLITIRKNQAFFLTEIEDLQRSVSLKEGIIQSLKDSLSLFKRTVYMGMDGIKIDVSRSEYTDTVKIYK